MGIEIERKFLVTDNSWLTSDVKCVQIKQGYLKNSSESVVRIRVAGEKGFITVKGNPIKGKRLPSEKESAKKEFNVQKDERDAIITNKRDTEKQNSHSLCRLEFEYEIPVQDALDMLNMCEKPLVEKMRYTFDFMGFEWCVDIFEGDNQGLVVAEIELESETQAFLKPPWAGREVTDDPRYLNSSLIKNPFSSFAEGRLRGV